MYSIDNQREITQYHRQRRAGLREHETGNKTLRKRVGVFYILAQFIDNNNILLKKVQFRYRSEEIPRH